MDKFILITGGELFNKGAQSMTFITVNELRKRFPDKKIVLLSCADYKRNSEDKNQYSFEILPMHIWMEFELIGGIYKLISKLKGIRKNKLKYMSLIPKLRKILENTEAIVDISGYALSSQWGSSRSMGYLAKIMLAKKYGIKTYLMPQSFGPFLYQGMTKPIINFYLKKYMKYPEVIYAREMEGYKYLHNDYKLSNVKKTYDLVLLNKELDLSNVYKENPEIKSFENAEGVAIIPNMRNFDHGNKKKIMKIYEIIINRITSIGRKVYLIRHSYEDIEACNMIKDQVRDNNRVIMISENMNCIEFDQLVRKFDFIIGSRFHSIVHAYKNGVPGIAIGWATKYVEMLNTFNQGDYIFDVRNDIDLVAIEKAVDMMLENYNKEATHISEILKDIKSDNIFDVIG